MFLNNSRAAAGTEHHNRRMLLQQRIINDKSKSTGINNSINPKNQSLPRQSSSSHICCISAVYVMTFAVAIASSSLSLWISINFVLLRQQQQQHETKSYNELSLFLVTTMNANNRSNKEQQQLTMTTKTKFEYIPLDSNSSLRQDVKSIWHDPYRRSILVELQEHATCHNPVLRGRLSGPALVILTWQRRRRRQSLPTKTKNNSSNINSTEVFVLKGTYQVPISGKYFVEIIALYCNDIDDWNMDFKNVCLEPVTNHRITAENTTIVVVLPQKTTGPNNHDNDDDDDHVPPVVGYWVNKNNQRYLYNNNNNHNNKHVLSSTVTADTATGTASDTQFRPLYTRFQPHNCRINNCTKTMMTTTTTTTTTTTKTTNKKKKKPKLVVCKKRPEALGPHCHGPMNMTRFEEYEFQWQLGHGYDDLPTLIQNYYRQRQEQQQQQPLSKTTLCFLGASHSVRIVRHLTSRLHWFAQQVQVKHVSANFPRDILKFKANRFEACSVVILGMGQWPASMQGKMTNISAYQEQLHTALLHLQNMLDTNHYHHQRGGGGGGLRRQNSSSSSGGGTLFLRSMHYNPLGDVKHTCPPHDWRNPRVVDLYNVAHQQLAVQHNLTFIDSTSTILGPMWDAAADWCHYMGPEGVADALYIAARALGIVKE